MSSEKANVFGVDDRMMIHPHRFLSLIFHSDLHGVRILLGASEILWALTLLWPGTTFDRPVYLVMSNIMREEAWGLIFLLSGVTQFGIVYKLDYNSRFSTYFAGWNMSLWMYVVISLFISLGHSPVPAAISGDTALALGAAWIWIRSGHSGLGRRHNDTKDDHAS